MTYNRDYGLPDSIPTGIPKVIGPALDACPNCGCQAFTIEIEVVQKLVGGKGIGTYIGCPACQYASPMLVRRA